MASPFSVAVVAEKPSVARDIARVLKATSQGQGYLHGNGYVVTWAIGHLVALAQPSEIRPEWKYWRLDTLPMLPAEWPLVVGEQTKDQFEVVRKIITSPKIGSIICATDAGREGELIFRYIYEATGCDKPVERLWISSLTPEAIRAGLDKVRDWSHYHPLADAAKGRSRADWLVGMNLSRAYTLGCGEDLSVGRVQTPTLAILVDRELAIRRFVAEDYLNVVARFSPQKLDAAYEGTWFRPGVDPQEAAMRLPSSGEEAAAIVARVKTGEARIEKIEAQTKRMPPPPLYDLTELQRHGNRLYGFSAQHTLDLAQALYERHKLISYPRTDSRHLSQDVARTLPKIVNAISGAYAGMLAPGTGERPLGKRFVDDTKVSDHHAIIPTGISPGSASPSPDEQKIYDLICRRLLSAWHDDHVWAVTSVTTLVLSGDEKTEDRFHSSGTAVQQEGWKVLDIGGGKKAPKAKKKTGDEGDDDATETGQALPPGLEEGQAERVLEVEAVQKKTRPPKRFTEGTLLTAMETAGKTLDDKELSDAMKENGLGTPATRAQIIEVLIKRAFMERRGKSLEAMDKGIRLIEVVHPEVKSPAMTGQWEAYLKRIERGEAQLAPFLKGIEDYVREVVGKAGSVSRYVAPAPEPEKQVTIAERKRSDAPRDFSSTGLHTILKDRFGFAAFRPNQEAVCHALVGGEDVLLVMPTGSGKSLCYQLPGIALGGTTLVISPLIALMEDQVAKMNALGFAADRIHSGRSRTNSRDVCFAYLEGRLDFLFIAPERLRVQGFPEMLAKRKPCLIAIDEAHCISQWGHDFRPDYRTIGQHLSALRPAPVIALTATATPMVQTDIARQLDLAHPRHFIHGFRRDNIAIEVVKVPQSARPDLVLEILNEEGRRPAIVYSPKRRDAETLARSLAREFPAEAYHAGLEASVRHDVQTAFLSGRLEVIVATIAFGMGIDKPDVRTVIHTALPGSVEGYYQEMGRAGRDGVPSRAILMHAYSDRYTHDFFFERDYPDPEVLAGLYRSLTPALMEKDAVRARCRMGGDEFDTALEKLWIHGGAVVDYAENVSRGTEGWRELYMKQREHKMAQFEKMLTYCETPACRMTALVRYFGDTGDSARKCGVCDFCEPSATVGQQTRAPNAAERVHVAKLLKELKSNGPISAGRLFTLAFQDGALERRGYEELLGALARSGLVDVMDTSFEKDGKVVEYRKVRITPAGEAAGDDVDVLIPVELKAVARKSRAKAPAKAKGKAKKQAATPKNQAAPRRAPSAQREFAPPPMRTDRTTAIEAALKAWRLAEARKKGVPAFRVLTDKVLRTIAETEPATTRELLAVPGIGLNTVEKFGAIIFRILQKAG